MSNNFHIRLKFIVVYLCWEASELQPPQQPRHRSCHEADDRRSWIYQPCVCECEEPARNTKRANKTCILCLFSRKMRDWASSLWWHRHSSITTKNRWRYAILAACTVRSSASLNGPLFCEDDAPLDLAMSSRIEEERRHLGHSGNFSPLLDPNCHSI